ncbi:MAG: glycosyltransferase [Terriglobales bacterium]
MAAFLSTAELSGPGPLAALSDERMSGHSLHRWHVMHVCDEVRQGLVTVECQIAAGMRPLLITPRGMFGMGESASADPEIHAAKKLSVWSAWRDARRWGRVIRAEMPADIEILHAYSMAAALASLRNFNVVVYDAGTLFAEDGCGLNAFSLHVLRRAEAFVLSHAAAVVVHSLGMRHAVVERGTHAEDVFLISPATATQESIGGKAYDAVYRHAVKRRSTDPRPPMPKLQPISAPL